jgi:hypothetical protein
VAPAEHSRTEIQAVIGGPETRKNPCPRNRFYYTVFSARRQPYLSVSRLKPKCYNIPIRSIIRAPAVALYLNRRLWSFAALNSWTRSLSTGFNWWTELHLNPFLRRFIPLNRRAWEWGCGSAAPSWKLTAGVCGLCRMLALGIRAASEAAAEHLVFFPVARRSPAPPPRPLRRCEN